MESQAIKKILQVQYVATNAATDVPGPGTYQPKNDIQGSG